ncbi:MAG: HD domain-containing protein [Planctomycetota bacterium]|nr:MAG: HD domain-containing protein [Planctomycetota bacterium]REJ96272.1 MAG: HD domain-containing protein [Planctomycetota bacterium]REK22262.1 MAG: HD domain-containing protein [Planctomycetota bacterium]REK27444.1 MAG: HD domain-containing protein [Planctomycetota bacterium]
MASDELPFSLETDLERRIAADPDWRTGADWGRPRSGHPEGAVKAHIADVLRNIDAFFSESANRERLRLIALIHDTFKFQVDPARPRSGENHHAMKARRFAERYITDADVLDVIELHDEAYNAWQKGARDGKWEKAEQRTESLLAGLGDRLGLYLAFYRCDNMTGDKQQDCFDWFLSLCEQLKSRISPPASEKQTLQE